MLTIEELKDRLTPQQIKAADLLVANEFAGKDRRTQEEIAKEVGISRVALYNWRIKNPDFAEYLSRVADAQLDSYHAMVNAALVKSIKSGSVKSMELFYKLNGRLINRSEVTTIREQRPTLSQAEVEEGLDKLDHMLNGQA